MTGIAASEAFYARLLEEHLVLVDQERAELGVLNPTAALLWLLLDEDIHDPDSLSAACAELIDDAPDDLATTIKTTLAEWLARGWLEQIRDGYRITRRPCPARDPDRHRGTWFPPGKQLPEYDLVSALTLRLGGRSFRVELGDTGAPGHPDTLARVRGVLSGMIAPTQDENPIELRWLHDGEAFWLASKDAVLWTRDESHAISSLVTALLQGAYAEQGLFATMHAAAVSRAGAVLLLPGVSGSGKSTLTAYLVAQGWGYLGDDIVALGRRPQDKGVEIHPFPSAIGLKPGSWPMLRPYYPAIDSLPVVPYSNRQARFLPVGGNRVPTETRQCLRAILLPRYSPDAAVEIAPISPVQALCELIGAGVSTRQTAHMGHAEILLQMLEEVPAYKLTYSDLDAVASALESLTTCR